MNRKCVSCNSQKEPLHRHHIYSDLYFVMKGIISQESYDKYENCVLLCESCHKIVSKLNGKFRKKFWKSHGAWARKARTHSMYLTLRRHIGTTVWERFLRDRDAVSGSNRPKAIEKMIDIAYSPKRR